MIDRREFLAAWKQLETRFGRASDAAQAAMYYDYLTEQMTTEEFLSAARAIWATAKWWPRPAEFLAVVVSGEWPKVVRCIDGYRPPDWPWAKEGPDGSPSPWASLSPRAQGACKMLGGMDVLRAAYMRDPARAREEWERAIDQVAVEEVKQLAAAGRFKALPPAA